MEDVHERFSLVVLKTRSPIINFMEYFFWCVDFFFVFLFEIPIFFFVVVAQMVQPINLFTHFYDSIRLSSYRFEVHFFLFF